MINEIYVRWYLKRQENRYLILDWQYIDPDVAQNENGFELEGVDENIIKTMIEVNEDNITYLGHYRTKEQFYETIDKLLEEEELGAGANIEWNGPGFYVLWGDIDDGTVCPALDALDVEYDVALENGQWISYVTGWQRDYIYTTKDAKDCLMDLYGCEIDTPCEQRVEDYILSFFDKDAEKANKDLQLSHPDESIISDDINNIEIPDGRRIFEEAEVVGRIDPANLP